MVRGGLGIPIKVDRNGAAATLIEAQLDALLIRRGVALSTFSV
jgi:hypothetical protein